MFAQANKKFVAKAPPPPTSLGKQLFPSSSPTCTSDIRDQFKKPNATGHATQSARSGREAGSMQDGDRPSAHKGANHQTLAALYSNANNAFSHSKNEVVDLTGSDSHFKGKAEVMLLEDDFSDDEDLDLDFEAPSALPTMPKKAQAETKENMPPPPTPTQPMEWSSSPASHWVPPQQAHELERTDTREKSMKRNSSEEDNSFGLPAPKKRVLPWAKDEDSFSVKTPTHSSRKDFLDPSASAIKEQKLKLKNQRQPQISEPGNDGARGATETANGGAKTTAFSLSKEQRNVLDMVVNKGQSVFFTGAAGTGKSVLMRAIIEELKKKYAKDTERVAVTASTGLAACNIGGITLHSFSGIGLGKEEPTQLIKKIRRNPKAKNRWLKVKCLIIDEISMVDGELFDKLSQIGRTIRNNGRPWGGIQLIITGDFFQLPPVPDGENKRDIKFCFEASTWNTSIDHTIGLTEVFRQRDPQFANMLNEMRLGEISAETERAFRALSRPLSFDDGVDMAQLYPTRNQVETSNATRLRALPGEARRYEALDSGDPKIRDKLLSNMMSPKTLDLKVGAQVMLIKNWNESLVNGTLGKVIAFSDEKTFEMNGVDDFDSNMDDAMAKARRKLKGFSRDSDTDSSASSGQILPVVQFIDIDGNPKIILCQPEDWKVELPNGEVQAKRSQLPLILAWALSIHKAQGQTLERVTVDLGKVFEKGQAYVALSRATSQQGLQVKNFHKSKIMAHPRVCAFYRKLYSVDVASSRMAPAAPKVADVFASRKEAYRGPKQLPPQDEMDPDEEAMRDMGYY
ncbi:ATP-dependent DNA helicase-like protein [Emericellopsis cladophorae]|uniref:ATP-dependent DNA helicase PIF1 n=1 Tax=Emericellopsis cladophorae TaxID=2686198 RepID=A0A9P9XX88_9HYPO|nr:ATP-dependent DNA helicase-like protein [Emericellopsis cladophorae]KAI6779024.1 ATP-dependent DNA helicase-like protein [Emericellopsis cladophorae]